MTRQEPRTGRQEKRVLVPSCLSHSGTPCKLPPSLSVTLLYPQAKNPGRRPPVLFISSYFRCLIIKIARKNCVSTVFSSPVTSVIFLPQDLSLFPATLQWPLKSLSLSLTTPRPPSHCSAQPDHVITLLLEKPPKAPYYLSTNPTFLSLTLHTSSQTHVPPNFMPTD